MLIDLDRGGFGHGFGIIRPFGAPRGILGAVGDMAAPLHADCRRVGGTNGGEYNSTLRVRPTMDGLVVPPMA